MTQYILDDDIRIAGPSGTVLLKEGKVIDDAVYDITSLKNAGALLTPIPNTDVEARAAFIRTRQQAQGQGTPSGTSGTAPIAAETTTSAPGTVTAAQVQTATAALASAMSVNSQKITNLASPGTGTDAANKTYVDAGVTAAETFATGLVTPTLVGSSGSPTNSTFAFAVKGQTVNAGTQTVDTGYKPTSGHVAKIDGDFTATDRTNDVVRGGSFAGVVRNYGGAAIPTDTAPIVSGAVGDTATITTTGFTIAFGISGGGTVTLTFHGPTGYTGTLDWLAYVTFTEN